MSKTKQEKKKKTKQKKGKEKIEVREMKLQYPEDLEIIKLLKKEKTKGKRIERFISLIGTKVLAKIDFQKNRIIILDTEFDVADRRKQLIAEKIVKKIKPKLQKEFPMLVEAILAEEKEEWLKKVLEMINEGAEVTMERTTGRCVWVTFKKGKRTRSLLIE